MNSVIRWLAEHPLAVNLAAILVVALGTLTAVQLPQQTFPEFSLDVVSISVAYPGASAAEIQDSIVRPIEDQLSGIEGMPEFPVGMRASMDGAIPADVSYSQWIQKQSAARQDEIVGPARGKLMREGKLPFDSLYTDRGVYLTLDQLRERNAAAFKRAGV